VSRRARAGGRLAAALLAAGTLCVAAAAHAQAAAPTADFTCTPGPADCSGWHDGDVQLKWFWPPSVEATKDCDFSTLTAEGVHQATCGLLSGGAWMYTTATVRIDRTPPQATGFATARPPDGAGWFNHPVDVTVTGTDAASGIAGCTTLTYAGPDAAAAPLSGNCRDAAGHVSAPVAGTLRYDATPPRITAARPERPPDHAGWYTRPVSFSFTATDTLSGATPCPTATFAGPDSALARVVGTCADRAGNVAARAYGLRYDATAPRVRGLAGEPGDGSARLRWRLPADARTVRVTRAPGRGGAPRSVVLRRRRDSFSDRGLRNARAYAYRVTAVDAAGNAATRTVRVRPGPALLAPRSGTTVRRPPLLRWTAVRGARYYNVQLFRDGRKVLSTWPREPRLRLPARWRFAGARRALDPGRYRWYVWPGFGDRSLRRFGARLGPRTFAVPVPPAG
jgi:hypothetical protein